MRTKKKRVFKVMTSSFDPNVCKLIKMRALRTTKKKIPLKHIFVGLSWAISIALGLVILCIGLFSVLPGWNMYIVQSGSMESSFSVYDMVITRPFEGYVEPGDIVTYQLGSQRITHRVDEVNDNSIITKGDANTSQDSNTILKSQIIGIYLFKIPKVGYMTSYISTRLGWFLVIVLPACLLLFLLIIEMLHEAFKKEPSQREIMAVKKDVNKKVHTFERRFLR